jgi:hypothetical protein
MYFKLMSTLISLKYLLISLFRYKPRRERGGEGRERVMVRVSGGKGTATRHGDRSSTITEH